MPLPPPKPEGTTVVGLPEFQKPAEPTEPSANPPPPEEPSTPVAPKAKPTETFSPSEPPPMEPLYSHSVSCHFGICLANSGEYIAEYKCDGKKRFVKQSKDYQEVLRALQEDVTKMRSLGKKIFHKVGEAKHMLSKHYGIVYREGEYSASYKCNGNPRFVARGQEYEIVLKLLKADLMMMRGRGAKIFHNIGQEKHGRRHLSPAKHVGISISARSQMYVAQMSIDGKNRVVASGRDYDKVLRELNDMCQKQRMNGKKINPKLGTLKIQYDEKTAFEHALRKTKGPLAPSRHFGVTRVSSVGLYKGVYTCDGKPRYVGQGRDYWRIVNLVKDDAQKMREAGHRVSKRAGCEKPSGPPKPQLLPCPALETFEIKEEKPAPAPNEIKEEKSAPAPKVQQPRIPAFDIPELEIFPVKKEE